MKKLLCLLLAALSVFTLTACNKTDSLQTEIDALKQSLAELQATVSSQSEQISTLQGEKATQAEKIAELESAKAAQAETIAALQNSAHLSAEEIAALEAQLAEKEEQIAAMQKELYPQGEICSLEEAYEKGKLTTAQLVEIAEIWNGARDKTGNYKLVRKMIKPENLGEMQAKIVKKAYAEMKTEALKNTSSSYSPENNLIITEADVKVDSYYGAWGDCYIVSLSVDPADFIYIEDPIFRTLTIGGVEFVDYSILYVWYPVEG